MTAAEHSGDALGASLIHALKKLHPDARFVGVGGEKMAAAGCRLLANPTARSAMLLGAVSQYSYWVKLLERIKQELAAHKPDVVVPIDSPTVNMRVARMARELNVPVCYYVAPQLWAWASWRMKKLAACADTVCCILPFEEAYFRKHGINAIYVGHPMFDVPADSPETDPARLDPPLPGGPLPREATGIKNPDGFAPHVALLPGSRRAEIDANLPAMLDVAREIRGRFPRVIFVAAAAGDERAWQIRHYLRKVNLPVEIRTDVTEQVVRWADLVLSVSGTVTLQVAKHSRPLIVMYAIKRWKWMLIGQFLIQTKFMSLVNILANRELAPEYMPFYGSPLPMAKEAIEILNRPELRAGMTRELKALIEPLKPETVGRLAGDRVAAQVVQLMTRSSVSAETAEPSVTPST